MALIDIVKYQAKEDEFVWKFPSTNLRWGTQVVVNPLQYAFFVKDGMVLDEFTSGTHTLSTSNIPFLTTLISLPFGGDTPFQAEVWFVNLTTKLDNKWGTTTPILLEDPKYGIIVPVRAYGQYGFKIANPRKFLETLTGNLPSYSANKIQEYFKGKIITYLTTVISTKLTKDNISVLEVNTHLDALSAYCETEIANEFLKYGLEIVNFYLQSVNVPLDDPSIIKIKEAKELTATIKITGKDLYQMDRSFDVLDNAAKNGNGIAGGLIGAGIGLGLGNQMGNQMHIPPPIPTMYYVLINEQQNGPLNLQQLKELIENVRVNRNTMAWKTGLPNWVNITELPEVANYFPPKP